MQARTLPKLVALLALPFVLMGLPALAEDELPRWKPDANADRADIPGIYKWDLSGLFPSEEAWEASRVELGQRISELRAFEGRLSEPAALKECLNLYFELHNEINRLTLYAALLLDTEQSNEEYQGMSQKGLVVMDELMKKAGFIRSEVLALPDEEMQAAYRADDGPQVHSGYLEGLRRRKSSILEGDGERVVSQMGDNLWAEIDLNEIPSASESTFRAMRNEIAWPKVRDGKGEELPLGFSTYARLRRDPNREVRREATEAFFATLRQYQQVFASTLGGQGAFSVNLARSRRYATAIEAYLDKDDLDPAVYHTLIETVHANLAPLHRYMSLRKKVLGVDELHIYDLYVPLVGSVETHVPFPEARETVLTALAPMGEEYVAILREGLDPKNGWLDLYPSEGKQSGAFCAGVYDVHPYVKMNYQNSLDDMSTLAHEYGHALHHYLSARDQSYSEFRYVPFLAEIASTANEVLLQDHLLATAEDERVRAMLLADRLESIKGTIYRQTQFAEFELAVHTYVEEGTPITAGLLERTYLDLIRRYYGKDFTIGANDGMEWSYIPHFYYKYYVFTYATGLSSGIALAKLVQEGPEQRDAYLRMLGGGGSAPPLELLDRAGVDLTRPDAIQAAMDLFDETLVELEALLPTLKD